MHNSDEIVIGIDVGGSRKGFHAVSLRGGKYYSKYTAQDATSIITWCLQVDGRVVGIDAPCRWRSTDKARQAEHDLAADKISCFITPPYEKAISRPFYQWMLNGAALYKGIEPHYPLYKGSNTVGKLCFETFPQAVACALAGKIVSAKRKEKVKVRRNLLCSVGIDVSKLTNLDWIDAALCAVTAHCFLTDKIKAYGDATDGMIVVPDSRGR